MCYNTYFPVLIVVLRTQNRNNCNDSFVLRVFFMCYLKLVFIVCVFFVCIFAYFNIINIVSYIEIINVFNDFSN